MRVVIPCAGRGTRFLPATRAIPKEMLPVVSKPVIEYVVEEAIAAGADDILLITGYAKRAIEDYFDLGPDNGVRIHFIRQKEPRGLGDALSLAKAFTGNERFGVLLGDTIHECTVPILTQLNAVAQELGGSVIAVEQVPENKVRDYGIVEAGNDATVRLAVRARRLIEKPAPTETSSRLGITGAYLLTPSIYHAITAIRPQMTGEIQLTDALNVLAHEEGVYATTFEGVRYDIGDPLGWLQTNLEYARRDPVLREKLKGTVEPWQRL